MKYESSSSGYAIDQKKDEAKVTIWKGGNLIRTMAAKKNMSEAEMRHILAAVVGGLL